MTFLSLDTSTRYSVAALCDERSLIFGTRRLYEKGRSDELTGLLDDVLTKARCRIERIDYFGVGVGPGSFTGLRIGLATVKGLSFALNKPCFAFSSLDAIAFNKASDRPGRLGVLVDARRSNVYCRFYRTDKGSRPERIRRVSGAMLLPFRSLMERDLKGMEFCGDALNPYKEELRRHVEGAAFVPEEFWYPTPESIAALTQESFKTGKSLDCSGLSALYLYERDCQVRRQGAKP